MPDFGQRLSAHPDSITQGVGDIGDRSEGKIPFAGQHLSDEALRLTQLRRKLRFGHLLIFQGGTQKLRDVKNKFFFAQQLPAPGRRPFETFDISLDPFHDLSP